MLGVNEQIANGAVPDALLPFHITKDDAVARIRQFVDKRRLFALKEFKDQFTPENVSGVYLPYMIVDANVSAMVAGKGRDQDTRVQARQRQRRKDLLRRRRLPDRPAGELHRRRPAAGIVRRTRQPRYQGQHQQRHQHDPAVRHQERGQVERVVPDRFSSEKRNSNVANLQPRLEDELLSIARAQAEDSVRRYDRGVRWEQEQIDVIGTRWVSMYLPVWLYSYHQPGQQRRQRRHAALHRGQRSHRRDDGQRAGTTMETADDRDHRRHLPRSHCTVDRGAFVMSDDGGLWLLAAGPAGATALYWALYRYYRNTDKSHAFERETAIEAQPVTGSESKVDEVTGTRETRIKGDNVRAYRQRVQRVTGDTS